ncbi:hypothetical protein ONE63_007558 [Megalurothrips usitatus]|uniref:C2H2-type domain-containing protein n=1 Tax=Megalurothrips usitatus TaxID=439358 RepID=A0AAV7XV06_9NEOP|nr:hypothetical protein ONE63_007558 [Megalurothrips usitatus]
MSHVLFFSDSLPLTDQLKRAIRLPSFQIYEGVYWQPTEVYNYIGIHPECCVEEEDFTLIKRELDMNHIGKSCSWDEDKLSSWNSDGSTKEENHDSFSDEPANQRKAFSADGKLHPVRVLPSGEVVPALKYSNDDSRPSSFNGSSKKSRRSKSKTSEFDSYKDLVENRPKKIEIKQEPEVIRENPATKYEVSGHECDKCGTVLKTTCKMREHLERHKQLESLRKHAGQLPNKEQLVKEVPVLVNRALKSISDEHAVSILEKRVEAYARRLYYNSFPLWKEISRELVHEVWQYVTLTGLTILPAVDWDHFSWSRNDSEVVELFFYKFFMKLNDAVYKFSMRCLGSPDTMSDSFREEEDARSNPDLEELHTLCGLVLRTYIKRASQNKSVKGWNAIHKCMKRNFVERRDTCEPPKSDEMKQWALEDSNQLITTKCAFKFFALLEAVIENINKVNPTCDGPVALHKMVLRAVYLRQDIIRAWDKLVASSHFEEMDSLYVLEMLVKSFAFFSGCASARRQQKKFSDLH